MKVTGPMKLQMKWLSTLSQHLWGAKGDISSLNHLIAKTKLCLIDQGPAEQDG